MVYKATLGKRVGMEVFNTGKKLLQEEKRPCQVVAVKVLRGEMALGLCMKLRNYNLFSLPDGHGFWDRHTPCNPAPTSDSAIDCRLS